MIHIGIIYRYGKYNRLFIFNKNVSFFSISLNDIRAYKAKFVELYYWVYYIYVDMVYITILESGRKEIYINILKQSCYILMKLSQY